MTMHKIESKRIAPICKALGYRKRTAYICPCEETTMTGLNWSGGSRSEYRAIYLDGTLTSASSVERGMSNPAPWDNPYEGLPVAMRPGIGLAKTGYFCGKPSTLFLYVHPSDMPQVLPQD